MEASCCVARKIFLSAAKASSRACTLDSRPTTNGVIMNGKMTTSRMGIIGSFLVSNFSLDVVTESPWKILLQKALSSTPSAVGARLKNYEQLGSSASSGQARQAVPVFKSCNV